MRFPLAEKKGGNAAGTSEILAARFGRMERPVPSIVRLKRSGEFSRVRQEGVSLTGKWLVMGIWRRQAAEIDSPSSPDVRFGVITSKKVGGAVVRNLVRRRIRHIHRVHRAEILGSVWCVTVARFRAAQATFSELNAEWCKLAKRAEVIRA